LTAIAQASLPCSTRLRRWSLLLAFVCVGLTTLAACGQSRVEISPAASVTSTRIPSKYATANAWTTATAEARQHVPPALPQPLPHFSDWRVAFLGQGGVVQAVALDSTNDVTGPALPDTTINGAGTDATIQVGTRLDSAGIAPDGKTLAYTVTATARLELVDLSGQVPPRSIFLSGGFYDVMWSPDSTKVLTETGPADFSYLSVSTGVVTPISLASGQDVTGYDGWIDNNHIAVNSYFGASMYHDPNGDTQPTSVTLESLDITTGAFRPIVTIHSGPAGYSFIISPDGTQALYYTTQIQQLSAPYTPQVALVDLATGVVTPLPTITRQTKAIISGAVWRPGAEEVAASTPDSALLLNLRQDIVTQLNSNRIPLAWTPDGTHLVLSTTDGADSAIGAGPGQLSAMTIGVNGTMSTTVLTSEAMDFPMLGMVRNP
jgi:hypothetical protein